MDNLIQNFLSKAEGSILGKPHETRLALSCFFSHGHILIEDVPGMGKTVFAKTFAKLLDLSFARIQFTNDLMPSDLVGVQVFNPETKQFNLIHGPVFHQFILADELNRGTPKTQSALLEAMEERQVTLDGITKELPSPFFVVATQNPRSQVGTHHLPESQLDRFMMKIKIGYPKSSFEKQLISNDSHTEQFHSLKPVITKDDLNNIFIAVKSINVSDKILDYVLKILDQSRVHSAYQGLSPRAGKDIIKASKAWAFIHGRDFVLPDDVQDVLPSVISHRLSPVQNHSIDQDYELTISLIKRIGID